LRRRKIIGLLLFTRLILALAPPSEGLPPCAVTLSGPIQLCDGLNSIHEGSYLSGLPGGWTHDEKHEGGDGVYAIDCALLGEPYGQAAASGTLFAIDLARSTGDGTGTITVTSATAHPPGAPWVLTAVNGSGQYDETTARDDWYYVVYTADDCGTRSAVSNVTGGWRIRGVSEPRDSTASAP
jgi:hypothetical protein